MLYYEQQLALPVMQHWLGAPAPSFETYDEDAAWDGHREYETMLAEFRTVRAAQIALLPQLDATAWEEPRDTGWGSVTLCWVVPRPTSIPLSTPSTYCGWRCSGTSSSSTSVGSKPETAFQPRETDHSASPEMRETPQHVSGSTWCATERGACGLMAVGAERGLWWGKASAGARSVVHYR
jgi:hypothetical protein